MPPAPGSLVRAAGIGQTSTCTDRTIREGLHGWNGSREQQGRDGTQHGPRAELGLGRGRRGRDHFSSKENHGVERDLERAPPGPILTPATGNTRRGSGLRDVRYLLPPDPAAEGHAAPPREGQKWGAQVRHGVPKAPPGWGRGAGSCSAPRWVDPGLWPIKSPPAPSASVEFVAGKAQSPEATWPKILQTKGQKGAATPLELCRRGQRAGSRWGTALRDGAEPQVGLSTPGRAQRPRRGAGVVFDGCRSVAVPGHPPRRAPGSGESRGPASAQGWASVGRGVVFEGWGAKGLPLGEALLPALMPSVTDASWLIRTLDPKEKTKTGQGEAWDNRSAGAGGGDLAGRAKYRSSSTRRTKKKPQRTTKKN